MGGQRHAVAVLPPGKNPYPLCRRLGGSRGCSGRVGKISPQPGFDPGPSGPYQVTIPIALSRPSIFKNKMYEAEMLLRAWYCSMNNH